MVVFFFFPFKVPSYLTGESVHRNRWAAALSILAASIGSILIGVGACADLLPR